MSSVKALAALRVIGALALCLAAPVAPTWAAAPPSVQVVVNDFMFQPMSLTVVAGTTVTWTNKDDEPHTVKSDTGLFGSGAMDTNESFSFKFDKPGTYHFTCSIHPRMVGTIIVQ
jgi:plastocyanin